MSSPSLPAAFRIVRQLLQQGPRPFHEILREGVAAVPSSSAQPAAGVAGAVATAVKGKGKKGAAVQASKTTVVPSDHPFISANYLKKRILPILHSQNLIHKTALAQSSSSTPLSPSERAQALAERHSAAGNGAKAPALDARGQPIAEKPVWLWRMVPPIPEASSSAKAGLLWDTESHWDRLCSGEALPSEIAHELVQVAQAREDAHKETLVAERRRRRTEREIMALPADQRELGLSTRLERLYLNKRRGLARPAKERKTRAELEGFEAARRLGEAEAQQQLAL